MTRYDEASDANYTNQGDGIFRPAPSGEASTDGSEHSADGEEKALSVSELLYSSSSYYAIAKPVTMTMVLSALAVVYLNTEETVENGEAAMAQAYQVFNTQNDSNGFETFIKSFANSLVMVTVICMMTFVIVLLYKFKCMKCLVGYMVMCSCTLLGVMGGNLIQTGLMIYNIPVDKFTYFFGLYNFAVVGVAAVFWGQGIPKYMTQAYLIATSVILAWHLSYFDPWTTWSLLIMLALYDLCAVLTPCGPLRFLVDLMSQDDAPDMPGLLYEAELPAEARRPGVARGGKGGSKQTNYGGKQYGSDGSRKPNDDQSDSNSGVMEDRSIDGGASAQEGPLVDIPLAVAKVYNLPVLSVPQQSTSIMLQRTGSSGGPSESPLLGSTDAANNNHLVPENPTPEQLGAEVTVRLPNEGGRISRVAKGGKKVYLETDRQGNPKRILWVDRTGKVFAEMREDDEDFGEQNSIRLGLGDFIFYSVLVSKAAQYSFATFAACILVILAGLGGTLVLLSVYHHALPALPISIFLGVFFYIVTRLFMEPWIAAVLQQPYYV